MITSAVRRRGGPPGRQRRPSVAACARGVQGLPGVGRGL